MTLYKLVDNLYIFYGEDKKWFQLMNEKADNSKFVVYFCSPKATKEHLHKNIKIIRSISTIKRIPWCLNKNSFFFLDKRLEKLKNIEYLEIQGAFSIVRMVRRTSLEEIVDLIKFSDMTCVNKEIRKYK